jgi:fucose 4-O-acetylase-like acetyltransferase
MAIERNHFVDIMRGIAMLLVVLGHTMTGCTTGAENSFLFNIVWSLQMPLFILISGYVTKYSRGIENGVGLWNFIKRRTVAYLFPWAVWSFLVRGILFGQSDFLNIKWLLWHMDSGYWFLTTIWIISLIFGISAFLAKKIAKESTIMQTLLTLMFYLVGMAVLAGIGLLAGLSFLAIKLTLYYMPFYFTGYLYGQYRDKILETKWGKAVIDIIVACCLACWLFIMTRYHLYALPDNGIAIVLRAISSITGCIAVCGLCKGFFSETAKPLVEGVFLKWCGEHSLAIYLTHYLLLSLLKMTEAPITGSIQGTALILANYLITVALTIFVIKLANTSRLLKMFLYGIKG